MVPGAPRTRFTDPALVRLLSELTRLDAGQAQPALAQRLEQWLHWTDATALSMALDDAPTAPAVPAWPSPDNGVAEGKALAQLRRAQTAAIGQDCALGPAKPAAGARAAPPLRRAAPTPAAPEEPLDAAALRRRYASRQQAMANAIEPLRARMRQALSDTSAPLAKLAALDAVMERVLGPRERALLGAIPVLLEQYFERLFERLLRAAEGDAAQALRTALDTFGPQMQAVLLAELDLRLQPLDGLMAALSPAASADPLPA